MSIIIFFFEIFTVSLILDKTFRQKNAENVKGCSQLKTAEIL